MGTAEALATVADETDVAEAMAEVLGLRLVASPTDLLPEPAWLAKLPLRVWVAAADALPAP